MLEFGCVETHLMIKCEKETGRDPEKLSYVLRDSVPENDDDSRTLALSRTMPPVVLRETVWKRGMSREKYTRAEASRNQKP